MPQFIYNEILLFYAEISNDPYHRYSSWEHCHKYFKKKEKLSHNVTDTDCLQLGFFLASWGMYRASSFLLGKSYEIHRPIVRVLLKSKYKMLWDVDILKINEGSRELKLIIELYDEMETAYANQIPEDKGVTDTLITKVMLGTLCCTPAYDRYFKDGCSRNNINPHSRFSEESLIEVKEFYKRNKDQFKSASKEIKEYSHMIYPPMKLIDMYLWREGYLANEDKKLNR
jgi:hypothetical protein